MTNGTTRILVADEDTTQVATLARGLIFLGFDCVTARGEAEALSLLAGGGHERIALLLIDVTRPDTVGVRLVDRVRAEWPHVPVLAIAGLARSPHLDAIRATGAAILRKPFTPHELGLAIEKLLEGGAREGEPS